MSMSETTDDVTFAVNKWGVDLLYLVLLDDTISSLSQ